MAYGNTNNTGGYNANIGGYLPPIPSDYFWNGRAPGQTVKPSWVDYMDSRYLLSPVFQSSSRAFPDNYSAPPTSNAARQNTYNAGETKTDTMYCAQSDLCRTRFCAAHPTCTIEKVERIQILPAPKYRIYYHYEPKYTYRGETGPDFCTKSCSNTSGHNSTLCEAWEKTIQLKRAAEDAKNSIIDTVNPPPPPPPGDEPKNPMTKWLIYGGLGIAGLLLFVLLPVVIIAKKKAAKK